MPIKRIHVLYFTLFLGLAALAFRAPLRRAMAVALPAVGLRKSIADRLAQYGESARSRWAPWFAALGVDYPPARVTLVGLKAARTLEVWVAAADGPWKFLRVYPILGMSGGLGPKLREGDQQVPEGINRVESLNPNSLYHLSLRVNYPNDEDRAQGRVDGRNQLGSDIMIHGNTCSIGCLAMGDEAAEDLFVLAAETGIENMSVLLAPLDFRVKEWPKDGPPIPAWVAARYRSIRKELSQLVKLGKEKSAKE